ncbi:hypothetical protein [Bacillus sp. ISL-77]|uniref:hypothetical protein n=1 Tax=Bacillus sp. ISL-77 TaxID=2819138 RepID=UPI001BE9EA0F|nr:hypothetical protein [Bacillus sp. ISL-77]MBT2740683.1 hypothetical protein [Bacillus sp. ISL-77]
MTGIKKITLVLNTDDPEQKELYNFVNCLPNGRKRNSSAFLRTIVDREYQKKKDQYLQEKKYNLVNFLLTSLSVYLTGFFV